jgi:hypothetical protein
VSPSGGVVVVFVIDVDVVIEVIYRMKKSEPLIPASRARGIVGYAFAVLV